MKNLYANIDTIVSTKDDNALLEKNVIHNLYRINKQLNYAITIVAEEAVSQVSIKALDILRNESIEFEIKNKPEKNIDDNLYISKTNFTSWDEIYIKLKSSMRKVSHTRNTNETKIQIELNPDGNGVYQISTGLGFFNHMLEQLSKHSNMDLMIDVKGDLHIDEHHTIEDTAIALGEAMALAMGNKKGMERYGFVLPMDDCLAQVAIDFGGRSWLVWNAEFKREKIGDVPTEMFYHFFKSFCDAAKCNLNIKVEGENEHHKIESIFKAFAKAIKMAIAVNYDSDVLPTTKGIL
ncbi:MAG TPA: imidazoleglycerol-phosphate dehydratase HisB [Parafilimonas sp.]|nr:imidazoleglycerol-phosphate dehydratase HisB [Parafilimonas sp.]